MVSKAKGLLYEKQEPAFFRRLRGEHSSDKQNFSVPRPRKARLETSAEDDGPTIVGEAGENVTQEEFQAMVEDRGSEGIKSPTQIPSQKSVKGTETSKENADDADQGLKGDLGPGMRKSTIEPSIGQKRKIRGKVVGGDVGPQSKSGNDPPEQLEKTEPSRARKGKKVKLSFNQDDA